MRTRPRPDGGASVPRTAPRGPTPRSLALVALLGGALVGLLASCDAPKSAPSATSIMTGQAVSPSATWTRFEATVRTAAPASARAIADAAPSAITTANPDALAELLAAVPKDTPGPTDPVGGTRVGSDTGEPAPEPGAEPRIVPEPPTTARSKATFKVGDVAVQTDMSSSAIEREARAQLYFPLVMRCRNKDGSILPADAVVLAFNLDVDGYIVPSTLTASASTPAFEAAAECMRRELSGLAFRGPAGARGTPAQVKMTVPSID